MIREKAKKNFAKLGKKKLEKVIETEEIEVEDYEGSR